MSDAKHEIESHSSRSSRLRLEVIASMQAASCDVGRRLISADDALDDGIRDQDDDYDDLGQPLALLKGTGLRIKTHCPRQMKSGYTSGRLEGCKFSAHDDRTSVLLRDLMDRMQLDVVSKRIHCCQTSRVYYATTRDKTASFAIKIFTNAKRRQLKLRAQHQFEILSRARAHGVRVPEPVLCHEHILATSFVGKDQKPVLSLVDVKKLKEHELEQCYVSVLASLRKLYQIAGLVHGDVSARSILFDGEKAWLVGFGRAVDREHPDYQELLQKDLNRLQMVFRKLDLVNATQNSWGLRSDDLVKALITMKKPNKLLRRFVMVNAVLIELIADQFALHFPK